MFRRKFDKLKERLVHLRPDLVSKCKSLARFRSRAVLYHGIARQSDVPLSLLYVGNGANLSFLLDTAFDEFSAVQELGEHNIWRAVAVTEKHRHAADLAVIDLPWPYDVDIADDDLVIELPSWIRQEFELCPTWEDTTKRLRKSARGEEMRKIRKYGLTFAATRDAVAIDDFYERMYLPHTRRRFGPVAPVAPRSEVSYSATRGALLQILRDGEVIAGSVVCKQGDKLQSLWGGFAGDDFRRLEGATGALYYYTLLFAFHSGYQTVDYCGSRPLLNDGVFQTKRRWGGAVLDDWSMETLLLQINRFSAGVRSFLGHNALVARRGDDLVGKILCTDAAVTANFVKKAVRRSLSPGMDAIDIFTLHGADDEAEAAAAASAVPVRIVDLLGSSDPAVTYCSE